MSALRCDAGATAIEYGLIAALVSLVVVAFGPDIGQSLNATFMEVYRAVRPAEVF
jgi:pilus assembly protein Flp/PilA